MGDIFEKLRKHWDAWKLEQKYMKRRRSQVMRKSPFFLGLGRLSVDAC